jgi:hypothetical protein
LDPTQNNTCTLAQNDDGMMVVASNSSQNQVASKRAQTLTLAMTACVVFGTPMRQYLNAIMIATNQAITDTGVTSIFIMEGTDVANKCIAVKPLTINLPDGNQI